jgi:light-harvesting protein B-800-850 alpha chain
MIYGKMWTVVRPTVGVPIFLGAVAVGSFCVHLAIVSNTTWVRGFLNGGAGKHVATAPAAEAAAVAAPEAKK